MKSFRCPVQGPPAKNAGFTLIELMIALVLGLLVVGAASAMFLSNSRVYKATESLGRVQEGARVSFELMARDIREAAGNPCSKKIPLANVIKPGADVLSWSAGLTGHGESMDTLPQHPFGTAPGARASGTDAIDLRSGYSGGVSVTKEPGKNAASFEVSTKNHGINDGDIIMVCDFRQAAVFQVTNAQPGTNDTIVRNRGNGSGENCSKGLGYSNPMDCSTNGNDYEYGKNSILVKLRATQWYIGHNASDGLSLYQSELSNKGANIVVQNNEIVDGVKDMSLSYLAEGAASYVNAIAISDWNKVTAVKIELKLEGADRVGSNGETINRTLAHIATIRNRVE